MGNPSIEYAEQKLGVHTVYEAAQNARESLLSTSANIAESRAQKRELEALLSELEFEIVAEESGNNPGMSQAALDRHLKATFSSSTPHRELRSRIRQVSKEIDLGEAGKAVLEADIRIESARLVELGGYLQYLAAVKMARPRQSRTTSDTSDTSPT